MAAIKATRSASSFASDSFGVMHGELNYTGAGAHAWIPKTYDSNQWYQFTFKDIVPVAEIQTRGRGGDDHD